MSIPFLGALLGVLRLGFNTLSAWESLLEEANPITLGLLKVYAPGVPSPDPRGYKHVVLSSRKLE